MRRMNWVAVIIIAIVIFIGAILAFGAGSAGSAGSIDPSRAASAPATGDVSDFQLVTHEGPVVVQVNGLAITQGDIDRTLAGMPENIQSYPRDRVMQLVLDQLINNRLLLSAGLELGLDNDPGALKLVAMYRAATIAEAYMEQVTTRLITDDAIRAYYGETVGNADLHREAHARQILVDSQDLAVSLIAELAGGAEFAALAAEHSTDPTGPSGGDLGFIPRDAIDPEFAQAIFSLEEGGVTPAPLETEFGWHIIKVLSYRNPELVPFEAARDEIRATLTNEAIVAHLEELKSSAVVVFAE